MINSELIHYNYKTGIEYERCYKADKNPNN